MRRPPPACNARRARSDRGGDLEAAICGGIDEVTLAWAPQAGRECEKCFAAMRELAVVHETRDN